MPTQSRLGSLSVLELDDPHPLDGLFPYPEQASRHLGDDMIVVSLELLWVAALSRAEEGVPGLSCPGPGQHGGEAGGAKGHPRTVYGDRDADARPLRTPIQLNGGTYLRVRYVGTGILWQEGEAKPVEPSIRSAGSVF